MPTITSADAARDAAAQLTLALLHPHPASPFAPIAETQLEALRQLAEIFTQQVTLPEPHTSASPVALTNAPQRVLPQVNPASLSPPLATLRVPTQVQPSSQSPLLATQASPIITPVNASPRVHIIPVTPRVTPIAVPLRVRCVQARTPAIHVNIPASIHPQPLRRT